MFQFDLNQLHLFGSHKILVILFYSNLKNLKVWSKQGRCETILDVGKSDNTSSQINLGTSHNHHNRPTAINLGLTAQTVMFGGGKS